MARPLSLVPRSLAAPFGGRSELRAAGGFAPGTDDAFVNTAVKVAILQHPGLRHAGIHVSTSRGIVQLSGFVASRKSMAAAVAIARGVNGVSSVRNDMLPG